MQTDLLRIYSRSPVRFIIFGSRVHASALASAHICMSYQTLWYRYKDVNDNP